jgi:hypothetical protein
MAVTEDLGRTEANMEFSGVHTGGLLAGQSPSLTVRLVLNTC